MPNGHKATFYDVWSGHRVRPARFQKHLHDDVTHVVRLLATGVLTAQAAARLPLDQASAEMELAQVADRLPKGRADRLTSSGDLRLRPGAACVPRTRTSRAARATDASGAHDMVAVFTNVSGEPGPGAVVSVRR